MKDKCPHCNTLIEEGLENVYGDMHEFIAEKEEWKRFSGPVICHAMLEAVMDILFHMAPSKEDAQQIIEDVNALYYKKEEVELDC